MEAGESLNGREKNSGVEKSRTSESEARAAPTVWNWSVKTLSPGALSLVLDFFSSEFSLARLDFIPPPLNAPGSSRMDIPRKIPKNSACHYPISVSQICAPLTNHNILLNRAIIVN